MALVLTSLGLLSLGVVARALATIDVPSPVAGAPSIRARDVDGTSITWLGDTLLGDGAEPLIELNGFDWPSALLPPLEVNDVVIANLEGPMTDLTEPFDPLQRWTYNSRPASAEALAAMGIDAISLANNHAMDRGPDGLFDTIANSKEAGLQAFGAGPTSSEARLPLLIESTPTLIAVIGFSDDGGLKTASSDRPGLRRLSMENLRADIDLARAAGADRVIAYVHWGGNYTAVDHRQETWAEGFAGAGYDLVVGTGPHVAQPISVVQGMPVIYSLGNHVFGTPGRFNAQAEGFGLIVTTSFGDANLLDLTVRCIQTDNEVIAYQPRPCDPDQSQRVLKDVNPRLLAEGDSATMTLPLPPRRA